VLKLIDDAHDALNNLWNENNFNRGPGYPQARMAHLFDVVGASLAQYIRKNFE
jgi:hypothetical protein